MATESELSQPAAPPQPAAHDAWYADLRRRLETAYLASEDVRGQSGFRGDAARWRAAREVILDAVGRDGTLLDVGCANGLLMESLVQWARELGIRLEPYGLDFSPALARLARRRLPPWADRIYVGNAVDWQPPRRFDFVRTELVYVPDDEQARLVDRLLSEAVAPGGRLIVCSYASARRPEPALQPLRELLGGWGHAVGGVREALDAETGRPVTRVAWVDRMATPHA